MSIFRKILYIFTTTFLFYLVFLPNHVNAETPGGDKNPIIGMMENWPKNNPWELAKEFCDKRSGELMNLETWYSGKCNKDTYTLSGEGVGFVDIIQLQALEWMFHPQYKSLPEQLIEYVTMLVNLSQSKTPESYNTALKKMGEADINKGIIPQLSQVMQTMVTTKPATTNEYLAYISKNLKNKDVIKNAYAAQPGTGFTGLSPLLPLWKAFRNIAYMLFAIAFVLYGLMIMFRIRIDGKTAASITLAIPKLITTLLLITFSYAIVGFLVDISTVITALLIDVLRVGGIIKDPANGFIVNVSGQKGPFSSFFINFVSGLIVSPFVVFNLIIGGLAGVITAGISIGISMIPPIALLLSMVIFFSIGWSYFKLITKLFQSYISIIVSLIFSPLILLGNILPGSKSFSDWMRTLIGNLATFPAVSFLLVLSYALMAQPILSLFATVQIPGLTGSIENALGIVNLSNFNTIWTPPMTVGLAGIQQNSNVTGGLEGPLGSIMLATIGLGILLMASKYVDMITAAFKVPAFQYGSAIGDALKMGYGTTSDIATSGFKMAGKIIKPAAAAATTAATAAATTPCFTSNTEIETLTGKVKIKDIILGTEIWSLNSNGKRVISKVIKTSKSITNNTEMAVLTLDNEQKLTGTSNHPIFNKSTLGLIKTGESFENIKITNTSTYTSNNEEVFDILPNTDTCVYFANGIPVLSSLKV